MKNFTSKQQNIGDFSTNKQCMEFLTYLRWQEGYKCPRCGFDAAWQIRDDKYKCKQCGYQTTVTAGTIFHGTHIPLTKWFEAAKYIVSKREVVNAMDFQNDLNISNNKTAQKMLYRFRQAMEGAEDTPMLGNVFIDLTSIQFKDVKSFINVILAVEADDNKSISRIRVFSPCIDDEVSKLLDSAIMVGKNLKQSIGKYDLNRLLKHSSSIQTSNLPAIQETVKYLENKQLLGSIHTFCANKDYSAIFAECSFKLNRRGLSKFDRLTELLYAAVHIDQDKLKQKIKERYQDEQPQYERPQIKRLQYEQPKRQRKQPQYEYLHQKYSQDEIDEINMCYMNKLLDDYARDNRDWD